LRSAPPLDSFPLQQARTRRFTLGVPRDLAIARDGRRVAFLRTRAGDDPFTCLWVLDVDSAEERLVAGAEHLHTNGDASLPAQERARRERARERSTGIVRFSVDDAMRWATFDLFGRLFVVELDRGEPRELTVGGPAVDPRLDPSGRDVAYVVNGALQVAGVDGAADRTLLAPETGDVTYGLAEFVAAEEMGRTAGYWWSPDGSRVLAARVDTSQVNRVYITDPTNPGAEPTQVAYPAAGSRNADVQLVIVATDGGARVPVRWDNERFEYLTAVDWSKQGLLIVVQSRDQRRMRILSVDPDTGETSTLREDNDDVWLDVVGGVPRRLIDGQLVWTADIEGAKRLLIGGEPVTGTELQVRAVLDVDDDCVVFSASIEPTEVGVWTWSAADGVAPFAPDGVKPGVFAAKRAGGATVLIRRTLDGPDVQVAVYREGRHVADLRTVAERPVVQPQPRIVSLGRRRLRSVVLFPTGHERGVRLPVLLDPYGGPHFQRVSSAYSAYLESQWFADAGFAVLISDGRGTPGRGPAWDRAVWHDLATPPLEDQVDALHAAGEMFPDLDLSRVAIRGWSFGGYLAALAVLRRPDVFHAAVAGAPLTDPRLYDTHYTERYLGDPARDVESYDGRSLIPDAERLERPLMLIHGLIDDNVLVANTIRLSAALLAAGRPHELILIPGATHMADHLEVAKNLLLLQLAFLRRALSLASAG
jgi:dipeptidyl-peptidase 4